MSHVRAVAGAKARRHAPPGWLAACLATLALVGCDAFDGALLDMPGTRLPPPGAGDPDAGPQDSGTPPTPDAGQGGDGGGCSCTLEHASATCTPGGGCAIDACDEGFFDCDDDEATGCEGDVSRDPAHCGGCGNDCGALLANTAETACGEGQVCSVVACADGFASCDDADATGCETSIFSTAACGACPGDAAAEVCTGLPHVTDSSCPVGRCEIDACEGSWANCDGDAGNGCEHDTGTLGPCEPKLIRLTIDASFVDAPLSDFPVLVRLTESALTEARSDGADLVFSSDGASSGASLLPFEIEAFDQAGGALVAWVGLASVSDTDDTVFYLRYGDGIDLSAGNDPSAVWDGDFESVHHFDGSLADATNNGVDGSDQGSSHVAGGYIAGARAFATSDYVDMGTGVLPDERYYTLSAWVQVELAGGSAYKYVMDTSDDVAPYPGMALGVQQSDGALGAYVDGDWRFSGSDFVTSGTWALIALRYDVFATDGRLESSIDGQPFSLVHMGDTTDARNTVDSPFQVGRWVGNMFYFDGSIDELRVSSTARSDAWMRAEYENQRSGSTFLTVVVE